MKFIKKHYLFFFLIPIVLISQAYLLGPDSKFGLIDVDNGTLYDFRQLRDTYPDNFQFAINSYKRWGTYSHQFYYLGVLYSLFGINFADYHIFAHVFKIIATIGIYPLFYFLSGSSLVAFLGAIFYSFEPSSMGSLYGISNGNDYPVIVTITIFLILYLNSFRISTFSIIRIFWILIFLISSLVISPERSLPVVFLIIIIETAWILNHISKKRLLTSVKRVGILLSPILLFLLLKPPSEAVGSVSTLLTNNKSILDAVFSGKVVYLLNPFISFSSTFLPDKYWELSILALIIPTILIAFITSKRPRRFILVVFLITLLGAIYSYLCAFGHSGTLVNQSIAGFYILGLAISFLLEYIDNKNSLYFGLFFGPFVSFIFILSMWFTSGNTSAFTGIYRYLTIASIFSCLFLANIIVLLHKKLYKGNLFLKILSLIPFLFLFMIVKANINEINTYYDASFAIGYGYEDQNKMRQLLLPYYQNLSADNPRLIYIDIHTDSVNAQYYGNTIYAGGHAWPMYWPNVGVKPGIIPQLIIDYPTLKSWVTKKDGQIGLFNNRIYGNKPTFYKPENFYAVRFVNKQLIDITNEIKQELKLYE